MNEYEDTYFFNADEAFRIALQHNRFDNNEKLQVCYYDGEKIESDLVNLIHQPIDSLLEDLARGRYRLPTKVDLNGLELSAIVKIDITTNFNMSLFQIREYRQKYNEYYFNTLRSAELYFSEPLRFYLSSNATTQVMQYVSRNIADALEEMGCEVMYDLYYGIEDVSSLKNISEFNPHATVNINHFNNDYLNKDCFNFVWFQDPMPSLYDNNDMFVRNRDFVYSLVKLLDTPLIKKGIEFKRQNFCVNKKDFKPHKHIERKKKIVFIGSSYASNIPDEKNISDAIEYATKVFEKGESLDELFVEIVTQRFSLNKDFLLTKLIPFIVRDISILWLCTLESEYEVEIYGAGWEIYDIVKPFYKGILDYGDDIAKVYNGATYSFAPHQSYTLQQRVLEAGACECISIVYDCLDEDEEREYTESLEYFKTKKDLIDILVKGNLKDKNFDKLLKENSYKHFAEEILSNIKKEL